MRKDEFLSDIFVFVLCDYLVLIRVVGKWKINLFYVFVFVRYENRDKMGWIRSGEGGRFGFRD